LQIPNVPDSSIDQNDDVSPQVEPFGALPPRSRRVITLGVSGVILVACIWYILRTFQWRDIGQTLQRVNVAVLVLGGSASIVAYWMLRSLRWHILLRRTKHDVPLLDLYMSTSVALSFAIFTPFQTGEMLKVELLKKNGMLERFPGYGSLMVEKLLDLASLVSLACISLLTTFDFITDRRYAYYGLVLTLIAGGFGLFLLSKLRLKGRLQMLIQQASECVGDLPTLAMVLLITLLSWALVAITWQVLLFSGGIYLTFWMAAAMMSVVSMISILSLIPGGIGISEVGTSQVLMYFGYATTIAQAGAIDLRAYSVIALLLGLSHLALWRIAQFYRHRRPAAGLADKSALKTNGNP
jgi:uncharacterized membrane protein YbhN (UPF0104 family)